MRGDIFFGPNLIPIGDVAGTRFGLMALVPRLRY